MNGDDAITRVHFLLSIDVALYLVAAFRMCCDISLGSLTIENTYSHGIEAEVFSRKKSAQEMFAPLRCNKVLRRTTPPERH